MRNFFNGWKRKVGCVTLLMASLLASLWITSLRLTNNTSFSFGDHSLVQLISREETMAVRIVLSDLSVREIAVDRVLLMAFQAPTGNSTGDLAVNVDPMTRSAEGSPYLWTLKGKGFIDWVDSPC